MPPPSFEKTIAVSFTNAQDWLPVEEFIVLNSLFDGAKSF
jgi:hypothetical protein